MKCLIFSLSTLYPIFLYELLATLRFLLLLCVLRVPLFLAYAFVGVILFHALDVIGALVHRAFFKALHIQAPFKVFLLPGELSPQHIFHLSLLAPFKVVATLMDY